MTSLYFSISCCEKPGSFTRLCTDHVIPHYQTSNSAHRPVVIYATSPRYDSFFTAKATKWLRHNYQLWARHVQTLLYGLPGAQIKHLQKILHRAACLVGVGMGVGVREHMTAVVKTLHLVSSLPTGLNSKYRALRRQGPSYIVDMLRPLMSCWWFLGVEKCWVTGSLLPLHLDMEQFSYQCAVFCKVLCWLLKLTFYPSDYPTLFCWLSVLYFYAFKLGFMVERITFSNVLLYSAMSIMGKWHYSKNFITYYYYYYYPRWSA